jgi:PAS domain S-box-containing protein
MSGRNQFDTREGADSALLEALFAETPIGLAFWDTEFRYQRVNDVLAAINGRPVDEHLGRRVSEVLPELGPQLEDLFAEVLATGEAQRDRHIAGETPAVPGVTRHWLASYFPVRDEDGVPIGLAATVVETTGERDASARASRAERRNEAIDAQLRAVYSALPVGVAFVTPELRYERVNEALARMNGLPVEAHLGRTVSEVLGEHGAEAERLTREVIARGEPMDFELEVSTPAAQERDRCFEITYFPVFAPAGLLGVGAVVRDVTDRRAHERERERLLHEALTARAQADAARRRATFLATVTRRLASSMDYEATLREVVSSAVPYLADWGLVSVVEPSGRLRLLGFAHRDPGREQLAEEFARRYRPGPASSVIRVLETGRPMVVEDMTRAQLAAMAEESEYLELLERLGIRHLGTWPIPSPDGNVAIGTLSLIMGDSGRRFAQEDLQLAQTVATRAGLHLTNARLHTERSEIARTLQDSLLPRELPVIPGVDLASAFLPAGDENVVGGDFFDVFANGDGVWTAILGDVSGKGAAAAAITAAARHTLRAAALIDPAPAANLALLNRVLVADRRPAEFCTVVQARVCPGADGLTVRLANGGHPPALILRADGSVEPVEAGRGPLVGVVEDAAFRETDVELARDDLLLLYTDGVTEVRTSDLSLGPRQLIATLADQRGRAARDVVEAVTASALRLQQGTARDDIALLAIRCQP